MPGIKGLVSLISDNVVANLALAGYPALTEGKILLGRQYQAEQSSPPRIVFIPTGSAFSMKDVYNSSRGTAYTAEQLAQNLNPSIQTDSITFEVRCWGVSPNQDPDDDFDYTQALYQQVIRSVDELTRGSFACGSGTWTDSKEGAGQLNRDGREFVFGLTFSTPVLRWVDPLVGAPTDVTLSETDTFIRPDGVSGPGCAA